MVIRPDVSAMITTFKEIDEPEDYYSEIDYLSPFESGSVSDLIFGR